MTSRRQTITELLDHLPDYEPAPRTGAERGGSGGTPRTPLIYSNPTIRELYRILDRLATVRTVMLRSGNEAWGSTVHAHLTAYYHSEYRIIRPKKRKRIVRGRTEWIEAKPATWKRQRITNPWIIQALVDAGTAYIDEEFDTSKLCTFEQILAWVALRETRRDTGDDTVDPVRWQRFLDTHEPPKEIA